MENIAVSVSDIHVFSSVPDVQTIPLFQMSKPNPPQLSADPSRFDLSV
jgi:hypothetical protein